MNSNLKNGNHIFRIDRFKVPAASREEFLSRVQISTEVLRSLPGFVEDSFFEQRDAAGDSKIVTIAIWENQQAFASARTSVQEHYKKIGFNPGEIIKRLGIEAEMGAYSKLEL
ncbi:MAG TPA: antibiotic biosynthesis monooxygenase family protein [Candidatus Acidoferrum sp.]|nr:antibiotic biosynthesis monooxygenase family protein [Candidatus Acidoferrum sp.]